MKEIVLRSWRVSDGDPSGLHVWFDPTTEIVKIYPLEPSSETRVAIASEGGDQVDLFAPDPSDKSISSEMDLPF